MAAKVNIAKHPVHPMLIPFPIGLWIFSLVSDIIYRAGGGDVWSTVAWYSMGGGIIGAIIAAVPGFIDLFSMKSESIRRIGVRHMTLNVTALLLFIADFFWRGSAGPVVGPFILSIIGVGIIAVSGWLGGSMVYEHGAAVVQVEEQQKLEPPHIRKAA